MIDFSSKDIDSLLWMFEFTRKQALTKATEDQITNFNTLESKIKTALINDVHTELTDKDFDDCIVVQNGLDALCKRFYASHNEMNPELYDELQKEILSGMDFYSTLKDKFKSTTDYLKEKVTKEIKARVASLIAEEDGMSQAQANIQVERDMRYVALRDLYFKVKDMTITLTSRYSHYSNTQKAIMQSLSLAAKEKYYGSRQD